MFAKAHAGPAVRRFARELGVNLGLVKGTGPKQRILKEDVQAYVKAEFRGRDVALAPSLICCRGLTGRFRQIRAGRVAASVADKKNIRSQFTP